MSKWTKRQQRQRKAMFREAYIAKHKALVDAYWPAREEFLKVRAASTPTVTTHPARSQAGGNATEVRMTPESEVGNHA